MSLHLNQFDQILCHHIASLGYNELTITECVTCLQIVFFQNVLKLAYVYHSPSAASVQNAYIILHT